MSYNKTVCHNSTGNCCSNFHRNFARKTTPPQQTKKRSVWVISLRFWFVDRKQLVGGGGGDVNTGTAPCITILLVAAVYLITDGSLKAAITEMIHTFLLQQKKTEEIHVSDCYLYKHKPLKLSNIRSIGSDYRINCEILQNRHIQTLRSHILWQQTVFTRSPVRMNTSKHILPHLYFLSFHV